MNDSENADLEIKEKDLTKGIFLFWVELIKVHFI